mgnify:FL=1
MKWPEPESVVIGTSKLTNARTHHQQIKDLEGMKPVPSQSDIRPMKFEAASNAWTFSRAIQNAMVDIADNEGENALFMGEDMEVAGAFGLNLALKAKGHGGKLLDMPLSESIIINSATGAALGGLRPIAEIQFGGFAALALSLIHI